jgi:RHH-type proline utilization regulon transcriptional repressor/proline dehydrogenase/delta 1-pyrroline-5-carboxylate dehydrogenase
MLSGVGVAGQRQGVQSKVVLMATEPAAEAISELSNRLAESIDDHKRFFLTPAWFQQQLLDWATSDPEFRVKLLRFVDVLPSLRSARAVADHVRQYFRDSPHLVGAASGIGSGQVFRPLLSRVVREGVFAMAHRFIAGESAEQAVPALRTLAEKNVGWTLDLLGEATLSEAEADEYATRYEDLLRTLSESVTDVRPRGAAWNAVPPVNISVKLSSLCAHFEPAALDHVSGVTRERLRPFMRLAVERGAFVNFDMEQYRYRALVHHVIADLLAEPEFAAYPHIGVVVQAYLRDSLDDLADLRAIAERRGAPITIRLVKGAYWDEERIVARQNEWPVPVYEDRGDTDASFERCTDALIDAFPRLRPAFGSHNPDSIAQAIGKSRAASIADNDIEFQMLYGMAEGLREEVARQGFRTRVYVPVGRLIPGMAYLVRRLLENTSNQAWFNVGAGVSERVPSAPAAKQRADEDIRGFRNYPPSRFFEAADRQRMHEAIDAVRDSFGAEYPLLIGEDEISARERSEVRYPADPSVLVAHVAQAALPDVETAVEAAERGFPHWRDLPPVERRNILLRAADLMEQRRFELAAIEIFESAKPWAEADGDVAEAIDHCRYNARQGARLSEPRPMLDPPGEENAYFHEGVGVAAIISPWNFPLAIPTGMTVAALAAGNAAILKPAAQSPVIAAKLVGILREAGVPPDVITYLPGPGSSVGERLVTHPEVDLIAFTGSEEVGLHIVELAGKTHEGQRNVKRVIAEMGGKNAVIIDDDADLDQAVEGALVSAFGYAGQKCSACSRLIIVGSAYDEALARLKNAVESLVVGPPHEPATFVPPVIGASARDRIMRYVDDGKRLAALVAQAPVPADDGSYVPPTVFTDVPLDSPLAREEIFGPVLSVFHADTFEQALDIAISSKFALTGAVYSRNPRHIERARQSFRVGNLYINRKSTGAVVGRQPFGGLQRSGVGEKAGGPDYLRQFMQPRVVTENTVRRGFAPEE